MPRVTRAALRSNTESDSTQPTGGARRVFGEITGNSSAQLPEVPALIELPLKAEEMPPKKTAGKGKAKKGKGGKKTKKAVENEAPHKTALEVLEDDNQSSASDAADEACENLKGEGPANGILHISILLAMWLRRVVKSHVVVSTPNRLLESTPPPNIHRTPSFNAYLNFQGGL